MLVEDLFSRSNAAMKFRDRDSIHWEVFAACDKYLRMTREEISHTHINSPRLVPINKSRGKVKVLHKQHLLEWARIKTSELSLNDDFILHTFPERIENAESVAGNLEIALSHYPREKTLLESLEVVHEYVGSIKVSHNLEIADDAISDRDYVYARNILENVLGMLDEQPLQAQERERIRSDVNATLRRIRNLTKNDK